MLARNRGLATGSFPTSVYLEGGRLGKFDSYLAGSTGGGPWAALCDRETYLMTAFVVV